MIFSSLKTCVLGILFIFSSSIFAAAEEDLDWVNLKPVPSYDDSKKEKEDPEDSLLSDEEGEDIKQARAILHRYIEKGNSHILDVDEIKKAQLQKYIELRSKESSYGFKSFEKDRLDEFYAFLMSPHSKYNDTFLREDHPCYTGILEILRNTYEPYLAKFLSKYPKDANHINSPDFFISILDILTNELTKTQKEEKMRILAFINRLKLRFEYIQYEGDFSYTPNFDFYLLNVLLLRIVIPYITNQSLRKNSMKGIYSPESSKHLKKSKELENPLLAPSFFAETLKKLGVSPKIEDFDSLKDINHKEEFAQSLVQSGSFLLNYNKSMEMWIKSVKMPPLNLKTLKNAAFHSRTLPYAGSSSDSPSSLSSSSSPISSVIIKVPIDKSPKSPRLKSPREKGKPKFPIFSEGHAPEKDYAAPSSGKKDSPAYENINTPGSDGKDKSSSADRIHSRLRIKVSNIRDLLSPRGESSSTPKAPRKIASEEGIVLVKKEE